MRLHNDVDDNDGDDFLNICVVLQYDILKPLPLHLIAVSFASIHCQLKKAILIIIRHVVFVLLH